MTAAETPPVVVQVVDLIRAHERASMAFAGVLVGSGLISADDLIARLQIGAPSESDGERLMMQFLVNSIRATGDRPQGPNLRLVTGGPDAA